MQYTISLRYIVYVKENVLPIFKTYKAKRLPLRPVDMRDRTSFEEWILKTISYLQSQDEQCNITYSVL